MRNSGLKKKAQEILSLADIKINGNRRWDIKIINENFYSKVFSGGSLSLGESYMEGWWECKNLDELFYKILKSNLKEKVKWKKNLIFLSLKSKLINLQKKSKAFEVGEKHYDIGNALYKYMLGKRMVYTCAYWKHGTKNLDKAQEDKLELVCKKIGLKPGMRVLDIGCGWGSFLKYAAEKYKIKGVGLTISKEQAELAKDLCKDLDIDIILQDYRDIDYKEKFDRIISLGMFEHVGPKNYKEYMKIIHRTLKDDGLFLLQTIGSNKTNFAIDPWIHKYIFPNAKIPSPSQIINSFEGLFVMEDWHNFGADYDKTLNVWNNNFKKYWNKIKKTGKQYDKKFYRMWNYYLLSCAGSFRARYNQLWQIVLSKKGVVKGYKSIR
ncbi:cyclopropane-fatty-acyl-phospholipid synthase [Candidatus Pacearchaeota archaeon CG10_big_fil_rev_8_21_14_0_10_34_12]|nr:MAG: cyclopropane-fatty-acyl-phospholipid synthase [Candidatus Pacearchaeota archaeon CG10_big_fil_rev_8_21_14_0_10_34_12]